MARWTFITNHGAVTAFIAKHNRAKAAEIAAELGTTERSVRRITASLEAEGYVHKTEDGRVNRYEVNPKRSGKISKAIALPEADKSSPIL